jgi:hypothetical protein
MRQHLPALMLKYYKRSTSMNIYYLYVKTHRITGLKYLGQTKQDPFIYSGSGKYWKSHLKKHGVDINTEIIKECQTKDELKNWGAHYSNLWNVVESNEWANLMPELGDGAMPGYKRTKESVLKGIETRRKNRTLTHSDGTIEKIKAARAIQSPMTPETVAKISETKLKDPDRFERAKTAAATRKKNGYKQSAESLRQGVETRRKNGTLTNTPETVVKIITTRKANGSYKSKPEAINKMVETRKANGSYKRTPESIAKQQASRLANRLLRNQGKT